MRLNLLVLCLLIFLVIHTVTASQQDAQGFSSNHMATTLDFLKEEVLDTITLDRIVHFTAPDFTNATAHPDIYHVIEAGTNRLKLKEVKRQRVLIIEALGTHHSESLTTPVALYLQDDEKFPHVLLLLPGGKALEAVGSYDAVRSRGTRFVQIAPVVLRDALKKKMNP
jgi:hypothetical protein